MAAGSISSSPPRSPQPSSPNCSTSRPEQRPAGPDAAGDWARYAADIALKTITNHDEEQHPRGAPGKLFDRIPTLPITSTEVGASLAELKDGLGQSTIKAAEIYLHATVDHGRRIAERMDELALEPSSVRTIVSGALARR